jgi:hypothetical protein
MSDPFFIIIITIIQSERAPGRDERNPQTHPHTQKALNEIAFRRNATERNGRS